jgi:nitrite reductase/ring-hydroxylating ferredoxin subunit
MGYRHARAATLIPDAYTSAEFFGLERERVFASSWVAVGTADQVEHTGQVILAEVAGRPIFVTRGHDGQLRGFHNVCRHRATRLLEGVCRVGRNRKIRCPYHGWTYDLDGNCLGTPLFEGSDIPPGQQGVFDMSAVKGFDKADYGLFPVRAEAGASWCSSTSTPGPPRWAGSSVTCRTGWPATGSTSGAPSGGGAMRWRPTTSGSARTSWSTTICPGCTRS